MKKIIISIVLISSYVYANNPSKEDLANQIAIQQEALYELGNKIMEIEKNFYFIRTKIDQLKTLYKDAIKANWNQESELTNEKLEEIFMNEVKKMDEDFEKGENNFFDKTHFYELGKHSLFFKFYLFKAFHDFELLQKNMKIYEQAQNELFALQVKYNLL